MKYPVYSIQDTKTSFLPPQVAENEGQIVRQFAQLVNTPGSLQGFAPGDFNLYHIGSFDTLTGAMIPISPIVLVVTGAQLVGTVGDQFIGGNHEK